MGANTMEPTEYSTFEPFSDTFRNDPISFHAQLLANSPSLIIPGGMPSACVSTYAQCAAVLRDVSRFSSVKPPGMPGMERIDFFNSLPVMNYSDPPQHGRLRKVVAPAFSPRRVKETAEATALIIDDVLASVEGREQIEVISEVTRPMSIRLLLGHFMGVAPQDQHIFLDFIPTLYLLDKVRPGEGKPKAYLDAWNRGVEYCRDALDRAKREHSEGLIATIATAQADGTMSDDEVMAMMVVLFIGGINTLSGTAASAVKYLALNPGVAERIRSDPTLAGRHYEESLRRDPPVTLVMRFAVEDVSMGGAVIRKGMPVYTMISVACQDPTEFPHPEQFDIDRPNGRSHLAFGQGIHSCIGNTITRATVPMLVQEVVKRMPNLRSDPKTTSVEWKSSPRSREMAICPLLL